MQHDFMRTLGPRDRQAVPALLGFGSALLRYGCSLDDIGAIVASEVDRAAVAAEKSRNRLRRKRQLLIEAPSEVRP